MHLYGVAQACALLAKKRKQNSGLAVIAGMLHDIYSNATMDASDHAHKGAVMSREILESLKLFAEDEITSICLAIYNHSDKAIVHGDLDEILKDTDVMQHVLYNPLFNIKKHERERYVLLMNEFGVE